MRNIEVKVEGTKLILTCDIEAKGEESSSGKSMTIATTEGNQVVATRKDGKSVSLGLNLYFKK